MPFDFTTLSPAARAMYIGLGRQWGSDDTLAQAGKTLGALSKYGAELVRHGFALVDGAQLQNARDGLVQEGVGRTGEVGAKKVTSQAYADAIQAGKDERTSAHSVLSSASRALLEQGGGEDAIRLIATALDQTRSAEDDADKLANQLTVLRNTLLDAAVAATAQDRGGPEAVVSLNANIDALRAAAQARTSGPGTPAATERLDILDGIIVTLARAARKAARPASKRLGMPAMLADFELTHLYRTKKPATKPAEAAKPTEATKPAETAKPTEATKPAETTEPAPGGMPDTGAGKKPG